MNQQFPSFPCKEMLQLSFLIFVQWNIKGNRNMECALFWLFLGSYLDNQGKMHSVQVIFIMYILGGVGRKNKQVCEMLLILLVNKYIFTQ